MSSFDAEGDESGEEERNETKHILKTRINYIDRQAIRLVTYELHGLTILVVTEVHHHHHPPLVFGISPGATVADPIHGRGWLIAMVLGGWR
jgi:hypothetical protein